MNVENIIIIYINIIKRIKLKRQKIINPVNNDNEIIIKIIINIIIKMVLILFIVHPISYHIAIKNKYVY